MLTKPNKAIDLQPREKVRGTYVTGEYEYHVQVLFKSLIGWASFEHFADMAVALDDTWAKYPTARIIIHRRQRVEFRQ